MLTLYHHPISSASRYVRLILGEYKITATLVEEHADSRRREFLHLNPAATLPVLLVKGDVPICGARVIAEYIDEIYGSTRHSQLLFPQNPFERAEIRRLQEWFLVKLENDVVRHLARERIYKYETSAAYGGSSPDGGVLRKARKNILPHMQYLEWLVTTRDWVGGFSLSYADFAAAAAISALDYMGEIDWKHYNAARDWYARLKSRPSFRPLLQDRVRAMPPIPHYADLDF